MERNLEQGRKRRCGKNTSVGLPAPCMEPLGFSVSIDHSQLAPTSILSVCCTGSLFSL